MTQVYAFKVFTSLGLQVCTQEKLGMLFQLHLCTNWIISHIFEQRVGFEQQILIKAKLVE